ncbi:MAG: tRNA (adenine-N1)-methyltransferase [Actinomycetota bacterium]|nr:tRNA (adenine-N1)-methyltransferase [Actinomycetota bacterium]
MTGVPHRPLEPGERVILRDSRGRRYLIRLDPGAAFHFHGGSVPHDLLIGSEEGTRVHSTTGASLIAFRPRLVDFVLKMSRGAQVIYPKDQAAILMEADVFPGTRVLEAGTGSGALTLALSRAVGPEGRVVSYELRDEHREVAVRNLETFFGKVPPWVELRSGDVREVAGTGEAFDRAILDMPEPGAVLPEVAVALRGGALVCCYVPTTGQLGEVGAALERSGFAEAEAFEVLVRTWHVAPRSVRPDHRMVGHTGFVMVARRVPPEG